MTAVLLIILIVLLALYWRERRIRKSCVTLWHNQCKTTAEYAEYIRWLEDILFEMTGIDIGD